MYVSAYIHCSMHKDNVRDAIEQIEWEITNGDFVAKRKRNIDIRNTT